MVAVPKPEGTKCFPDPGRRSSSSWQQISNGNSIGRLVVVIFIQVHTVLYNINSQPLYLLAVVTRPWALKAPSLKMQGARRERSPCGSQRGSYAFLIEEGLRPGTRTAIATVLEGWSSQIMGVLCHFAILVLFSFVQGFVKHLHRFTPFRGVGHWSSWESATLPSESIVLTDHRHTPENRRHRLPGPSQRISFRDGRCLSSERVYWPEDQECHTLLTKVCT